MKYFNNISNLEQLRAEYKRLLKQHHPDNGGTKEATQEINAEYEELYKALKDKHDTESKTENKWSYDWNSGIDKAIREAIQKVIHLEGIQIDVVGRFVWVYGNTYPYREQLKAAELKWSAKHKKWYKDCEPDGRKVGKNKMTYQDIVSKYGCETVETEKQNKIA